MLETIIVTKSYFLAPTGNFSLWFIAYTCRNCVAVYLDTNSSSSAFEIFVGVCVNRLSSFLISWTTIIFCSFGWSGSSFVGEGFKSATLLSFDLILFACGFSLSLGVLSSVSATSSSLSWLLNWSFNRLLSSLVSSILPLEFDLKLKNLLKSTLGPISSSLAAFSDEFCWLSSISSSELCWLPSLS